MKLDEGRLYEIVGERVRRARSRAIPRLSQAGLAKRLGISRASVVNIEAGRQHAPLHLLWRIAEILGTELSLFIPNQAEYLKHTEQGTLDQTVTDFIETYSDGNPSTRRLLTDFVKEARSRTETSTTL